MLRIILSIALAGVVASCASPYTEKGAMGGLVGGFAVTEVRQDVWRVSFEGNGYTNKETVQTYWLFRSAQLAVEKGYDGFEILSDLQFAMPRLPGDPARASAGSRTAALDRMQVAGSPREFARAAAWRLDEAPVATPEGIKIARGGGGGMLLISYFGGPPVPAPRMEGDVHLIRKPFRTAPPKVFDARALQTALVPHMNNAGQCGGSANVCPHAHDYLAPQGRLQ